MFIFAESLRSSMEKEMMYTDTHTLCMLMYKCIMYMCIRQGLTVDVTVLKLATQTRLLSNSERSTCFCFLVLGLKPCETLDKY